MKVRDKWFKIYSIVFNIALPIIIGTAETSTGLWLIINKNGNKEFNLYKLIVIVSALIYIIQNYFFLNWDIKRNEKIKNAEKDIEFYKNENEKIKELNEAIFTSLSDLIGFLNEDTTRQINLYKSRHDLDTEEFNILSNAIVICKSIHQCIVATNENAEVSVNYYVRVDGKRGKMEASKMVAHEGYNSSPQKFGVKKLFKRKNSFFYEKILENKDPSSVFLKDKNEVAKAFGRNVEQCKYSQYLAIPVRRFKEEKNIALIEFVVHNESVVWTTKEDATNFVNHYITPFKEFLVLIDRMLCLYDVIKQNSKVELVEFKGDGKDVERKANA